MDNPIAKLSAALVAASAEMPAVGLDQTNPFLKNRFASLGAVIAAVRPILAKHSLAIMQFACSDEQGRVGVRTRLLHSSGEFLEESIYLEVVAEAGKSRGQVAGSIITYLRRYAQSSILNLYADEDTDGNVPSATVAAPKPATASVQPKPTPTPAKAPSAPAGPSLADRCKSRFLEIIKAKALEPEAWLYAVDKGLILPTERLEDARPEKFPSTSEAADRVLGEIQDVGDRLEQAGGMSQEETEAYEAAHLPEPAKPAEPEFSLEKRKNEAWRAMPIPAWSKDVKERGHKTFGELDKKQLWWWCAAWKPSSFNGKPPKAEDMKLRAELDKVRDAHGFTEAKQ
jgi:ERF superfamily protein